MRDNGCKRIANSRMMEIICCDYDAIFGEDFIPEPTYTVKLVWHSLSTHDDVLPDRASFETSRQQLLQQR